MTAATVGAMSPVSWAALGLAGVLIVAGAVLRFRLLDRLGARLAGEPKARREALARTGTTDGAKKVARLAAMLADAEEVRLIRWTPARTTDGTRIVLGASPAAWWLWLAEPAVLLRVPDTLVARAEHIEVADGVAKLRCESRGRRLRHRHRRRHRRGGRRLPRTRALAARRPRVRRPPPPRGRAGRHAGAPGRARQGARGGARQLGDRRQRDRDDAILGAAVSHVDAHQPAVGTVAEHRGHTHHRSDTCR